MSFVLQQIEGVRVGLREIRRDDLLIGRGTNAHVRSENAALAFEHATITDVGDGWELVDRGSITGTYLNGRPVERSRLKKGDRIEAADLRLDVQVAERGRPLFLRIERMEVEEAWAADARPATAAGVPVSSAALVAPKKDYAAAYRLRRRFWSRGVVSVAATLFAAVAVATVAGRGRLDAFSPGPLSAAHAGARLQNGKPLFPAQHCAACHTPFGGPSDARCEECHQQAFHQASLAETGSCGTCHAEHRSIARLSEVHQAECLDCHRDLGKVLDAPRVAKSIGSFDETHPAFTLASGALPGNARIPLAQAAARRLDRNGLRFDHACHTGGKCNVRPPAPGDPRRITETLECTSCHQVDGATGSIILLRYEESCARCHPLTFDNRFPPVPHGLGLDAMAGVVANAYAGNRDLLNKTPDEVARIFARSRPRAVDTDSATVRNAQRLLRVRCEQCHELRQGAVVPVRASRQWFTGMRRFDHRPHLNESLRITCTDCHATATASKSSSDILVPDIDRCRSCHGEQTARDDGLAACTTCHYYHAASSRFGAGWTAKTITASLTPAGASPAPPPAEPRSGGAFVRIMSIFTLFLLAVAAFAALFWVWRRFERNETSATSLDLHGQPQATPPPAPRAPATPPPPPARPAAAAPPAPPPVAPASPPPEPTVAINLRAPEPEAPVGGTVVIEWVGVLVGITGPYKGKKIPIDPAGFYIGRDKELSTVVVDDPRISRRHVWIGVKNGKVMAVEQGSTNGTFLNNVGSAPIAEVELKAGDVLILADQAASFRFEP